MSLFKVSCCLFLEVLLYSTLIAQGIGPVKKEILSIDYPSEKWEYIVKQTIQVSNDGRYLSYVLDSIGSWLVVRSIRNDHMCISSDASDFTFSGDSKWAVWKQGGDSLCILNLKDFSKRYLHNVLSVSVSKDITKAWIFCINNDSTLIATDLNSHKEIKQHNVNKCVISNSGMDVMYISNNDLYRLNVDKGKSVRIRDRVSMSLLKFDVTGQQFLFASNEDGKKIYNYKLGMDTLIALFDQRAVEMDMKCEVLDATADFNVDGNYVFFKIQSLYENVKTEEKIAGLQIYKSIENNQNLNGTPQGIVVRSTEASKPALFLQNNQNVITNPVKTDSRYVLIEEHNSSDGNSEGESLSNLFLYDLHFNLKRPIAKNVKLGYGASISPTNKYVLYYDRNKKAYFCYEIDADSLVNVTENIPYPLYQEEGWGRREHAPNYGVAGWYNDDRYFLVYDKFDIWRIDIKKNGSPYCLTRECGRSKNLSFRFLFADKYPSIEFEHKGAILATFDRISKKNGFYRLSVNRNIKLDSLIMSDDIYCLYRSSVSSFAFLGDNGIVPINAKNAKVSLVLRLNSNSSPNVCITSDFKNFRKITFTHPERRYNWLNSDLISYPIDESSTGEAIVYKPKDFDSTKRYPIIFYFYEHCSDFKNQYIFPSNTSGQLPIPNFVSNGYIVCVPNIYYESGQIGRSVTKSILAAVNKITNFKYIDSTKMGIQGHSLGGYEVLWLITQTNKFAAAACAAGAANLISNYSLAEGGFSMSEEGSYRLDTTLWGSRNTYIENSPVFFADKIFTPVLIEIGKLDDRVPYSQGMEIFRSLKRLRKEATLLEYANSGHSLSGDDGIDYNRRLFHFFNYYLKR